MQTPYTQQRKQKKLVAESSKRTTIYPNASIASLDSIDVEKEAQIAAHKRRQSSVKAKLTRFAHKVSRRSGGIGRRNVVMRSGFGKKGVYGVYTCGNQGTVVFVPGIAGGYN